MTLIAPVSDPPDPVNDRVVTVYHFDKKAALTHCVFQNLVGVQLFEWQKGTNHRPDGPVMVDSAGPQEDCVLVGATASRARDHGTHTLGLLVAQLEEFARSLPPSDFPYFNVVHVPLPGAQFEGDSGDGDGVSIQDVFAKMGLSSLHPDVVSISLSWLPSEGRDMARAILDSKDITTFVVAAPQQEAQNECTRAPAALRTAGGELAENVISVVGLDLADLSDPTSVTVLQDAGTGDSCHEIGAFGKLVGPIGDSNAVGELAGSSQATPVVAATVAEMVRRLQPDEPEPRDIGVRLVGTGWLGPDFPHVAKATLLDSASALSTSEALVVTGTGCKALGTFAAIKNETKSENDNYIYLVGGGQKRFITAADQDTRDLLSFRNLDDTTVIVAHTFGGKYTVEVGVRQSAMERKFIEFDISALDPARGACDGFVLGHQFIPVKDVDQLVISKLGD
jgi:hypothetical protein